MRVYAGHLRKAACWNYDCLYVRGQRAIGIVALDKNATDHFWMSESKPFEDASLSSQMLSEPRSPSSLGTNLEGTCLLSRWQPVYRRHDLNTGFDMERENLASDAKGKDKRLPPRGRIPMQRSRGGAVRSSDEILVMRMERRDGVAQLATVTNLLRQGGVA